MATSSLYGNSSESIGLYGIGSASGGTYFEWFIFYDSATAPATPTGGSWSFTTNTGTPPTGWLASPPPSPTNQVWVSLAIVDSRSTAALTWSVPGLMSSMGSTIANYITFVATSAPAYSSGRLWYDSTQNALSYYNDITNNTIHIGQETQLKVRNTTGATIAKGAPVYVLPTASGFGFPLVALAQADTATKANCIGLANQAIPNNTDGYIVINGLLTGANTGTFAVGDVLYLSPYSAGQLMNTVPPTGYAVRIGVVAFSNTPNGTIYVNESNAFVLAGNIVGTIGITNGGTGATTASGARTSLGLGTVATQDANSVAITGGSITGITDLAIADGGTGASTAAGALTNLGAVGLTDVQTLTNKTISGASNTLTNIGNGSLTNSSVTINGSGISLGGTATITAATPNNLVFGSGLSASGNFNGSVATNVTLANVGTAATYGDSGTIPVFTTNAFGQIASVSLQSVVVDSADISGTIAIAQGGTGASSAANARVNLLPSYAGNAGEVLALNAGGTDVEWRAVAGTGTVSSVAVSGGTTGLTTSGGPITAAGTITLAGTLATANGGTNLTSFTSGGVVYASSTSALATGSALTFNGNALGVTGTGGASSINITDATSHVGFTATPATGGGFYFSNNRVGSSTFFRTSNVSGSDTIPMTFLSNGNVGIGTSSPTGKFQVVATNTGSTFISGIFSNEGLTAGSTVRINLLTGEDGTVGRTRAIIEAVSPAANDGALIFQTRSAGTVAEKVRIDASGNLGLGVTPSAWGSSIKAIQMGFAGSTAISGRTDAFQANFTQNAYDTGSNTWVYLQSTSAMRYSQASSQHQWYNAPSGTAGNAITWTQAMTLDGSGRLLVVATSNTGTNTKLAVGSGNASTNGVIVSNTANGAYAGLNISNWTGSSTTNGPYISFDNSTVGTWYIGSGNGVNTFDIATTWGTPLVRVNSSGSLGIGTTSPTQALSLARTVGNSAFISIAGNGNTPATAEVLIGQDTSSNAYLFNRANAPILFGTNNATTMTLSAAGNLGLGVTPNALSVGKAVEVGALGISLFGVTSNEVYLTQNTYFNAGWKYATTSAAARYGINTGVHQWFIAPSGTAGTTATFTQAMTLTAAGELLVGATSLPTGGGIVTASSSAAETKVSIVNTGTSGRHYWIGSSNTSSGSLGGGKFAIFDQTASASRLVIDSSGNVGIGTTSPATILDIVGSGNPTLTLRGSAGAYTSILKLQAAGGGSSVINATGASSDVLIFQTTDVERMRLTSTGLGIGTSSPRQKLSVGTNLDLYSGNANTPTVQSIRASTGNNLVLNAFSTGITYLNFDAGTGGVAVCNGAGTIVSAFDSSGNFVAGASIPQARIHGSAANPTNGIISFLGNTSTSSQTGAKISLDVGNVGNSGLGIPDGSANALSFFVGGMTSASERARITSGGQMLVGATASNVGAKFEAINTAGAAGAFVTSTVSDNTIFSWNKAIAGDNLFIAFGTEASYTGRGSITYNRAGGLVAYNVTSDYRAKDISGPVTDSGALIDSVPVYMGKMKDATQERPMFLAHETPTYAHTGEKDAVDADGNPVYQQMDASALIPVMWAEIQSLRQRLSAANL